jgi:hypothetical protein
VIGKSGRALKDFSHGLACPSENLIYAAETAKLATNNNAEVRSNRPQGKTLGAKMNFAIVLILALLLPAAAIAAETAAMFAKSVMTAPGLHPWTIVTFPDECLVVEFKLDPFVAKQRDLKSEFGAIARTIVPAALEKFPKLKSVQLTGLITVRDKRGNEREVQAVMAKFYRATSASIKWDTISSADVIGASDKKTVSPILAKTVAQ